MNRAIVSLADSNYFELLLELINSIKRFPQSEDISICILDAGLKDNQLDILKKKVAVIKKAEWDIDLPFYKNFYAGGYGSVRGYDNSTLGPKYASVNLQETKLDPDVLMFKKFLLENKIELMPKK